MLIKNIPGLISLVLLILLLVFIPPFNIFVILIAVTLFTSVVFFTFRHFLSKIHAGYLTMYVGVVTLLHLLQILTVFNVLLFSAFTISSYLVLFKKW